MKSFGKILGLFFLGVLLILVALGFALTHLFDPNDYKDEIRQIARDKANLELTLNGDIGWSLFPWLGLELHDATLASATTPNQPFADLRMIGLSVRVLPLLRREVQMSDIKVDGLNLTLARDEQGRGNWQDIGRPAKPAAPADAGQAPQTTPPANEGTPDTKPSQPMKLDIDSLTLANTRIDYKDAKTGRQFSAEGIELTTGAIREGANIPLKLTAFLGTNQPVLRAKTELAGELRFDRALKRYQFEDLKLSGEASGEPLNGKTVTFAAQGQLLLDQGAQVAEWNGLKFSANQLRALGELNVRELDKEPQLTGGISIAEFNLREFLDGIGHPAPASADANALSKVELVARLQGNANSLAFNELKLKVDESAFTGSLAVTDIAKQALSVQLKGDKLNLDNYLPAKKKEDEPRSNRQNEVSGTLASAGRDGNSDLPNPPSQQAWSEEPVLPIDQLRKVTADLNVGLGLLTVDKLPIENASIKANAKDGLLTVENVRGDLYNGNFNATASLDVRPAVPLLKVQKRITRVPVEKLLATQKEKPPVRGLLDLNADFSTSGNSEKTWIEALNGNASFALSDGALIDANLEQQLCKGIATLNRKSLSGEPRSKDTPFEQLDGTLSVRNGVANNPDLKVRIPGLRVNGNGDIDLRVLGMDYRVGIIIDGDKSDMPDPACEVNKRYVDVEWPLRCRGPLELGAKACRLDKDGMGKVAAKLAGDKLNEKLEEKLGDKVSPELKDALKGLFKR